MQLLFNENSSTTRDLGVVIDPTSLMFPGSIIELAQSYDFSQVNAQWLDLEN